MTERPIVAGAIIAEAARELADLEQQVDAARAELATLEAGVETAESLRLGDDSAALRAANEQLVLAALQAQTDTETAQLALTEAARSAEHDPLTQLPNRMLLLDRFAQAIANARRRGNHLALLFLDLNHFKTINDTLGHSVGDEVLQTAAHCLSSSVRAGDTVSRHGGDEFLILLPEVAKAADAMVVAEKVNAALGTPSRIGDHVLRLSASIGISIYPDDGDDAETLIDRADAAMYRAKRRGHARVAFSGEVPTQRPDRQATNPTLFQEPVTPYERVIAEHDRRHLDLREANEKLILAAISAQELQAAAERAHRQQTEFLAVLAHELRNPLMPIGTAAALLGRVRSDELPRMQAIIERGVSHLTRLVDDLQDVTRIQTNKLRLERQRVDMADIVDIAIDSCRPSMDSRLQRFLVQIPSRALEVDGDPVRLSQLLCNLLDNASKYTPNGGTIRLVIVVRDDMIVLTICDTGIGISARALPTIFEPFVQDAHAPSFHGAGLGIGLTVVRDLVEAHGGTVVASSEGLGKGSQFVISLPMMVAVGGEMPAS